MAVRAIGRGRNYPVLITGKPGVGKTAFSQALAEGIGAEYLYSLLHAWTTPDELIQSVNVPGVVDKRIRKEQGSMQDGILLQAIKKSQQGKKVVLCLDEIDKANESVENLLLDFLQNYRVPENGILQTAKDGSLIVIITSNGIRELGEPFLRRCRRLHMKTLPDPIIVKMSCGLGLSHKIVKTFWGIVSRIQRSDRDSYITVQEFKNFLDEVSECRNQKMIYRAFYAWIVKSKKHYEAFHTNAEVKKSLEKGFSFLGVKK